MLRRQIFYTRKMLTYGVSPAWVMWPLQIHKLHDYVLEQWSGWDNSEHLWRCTYALNTEDTGTKDALSSSRKLRQTVAFQTTMCGFAVALIQPCDLLSNQDLSSMTSPIPKLRTGWAKSLDPLQGKHMLPRYVSETWEQRSGQARQKSEVGMALSGLRFLFHFSLLSLK